MLLTLFMASLALQVPAQAQPVTDPVVAGAAAVPVPPTPAPPRRQGRQAEGVVCENRARTGSTINRPVCRTRARANSEAQNAQNYLQELTRGTANTPPVP